MVPDAGDLFVGLSTSHHCCCYSPTVSVQVSSGWLSILQLPFLLQVVLLNCCCRSPIKIPNMTLTVCLYGWDLGHQFVIFSGLFPFFTYVRFPFIACLHRFFWPGCSKVPRRIVPSYSWIFFLRSAGQTRPRSDLSRFWSYALA